MFKKILIANDGSDHAMKALAVAIEVARQFGAELHQIAVEEDLPRYAATVGEVEEVKQKRNGYFAMVNDQALTAAKAAGVTLIPHILPGHEVETIVTFCKEGHFDLLVIGFMGHSRIFERVWGSTSQNLTRLAPCSVLVVK